MKYKQINSLLKLVLLSGLLFLIPSSVNATMPFSVGERLDFKVYFEFILAGDANMSVKSIEKFDGFDCYKISSEARSTPTVDMMYKVRDRIESWRDVKSGYSRQYVKRLREGKFKDDKVVIYHPELGTGSLQRKPDSPPDAFELEKSVYDILNAFYEVRLLPLETGQSVYLDVHDIDELYVLEIKVLRKERVEVPAGVFDCLVIEPMLQSAGIFRREGNLQIWLTDDEYRMPVLMKSKLYFGSVWARLVGYRRGE